ncbi:MAG: hypothetical protein KA792_00945 [Bacteroidales bacterium]|nr:hypothetical protein [Bacteroidales bacterium]
MLIIEKNKIKYQNYEGDNTFIIVSKHKGYFLRFLNEQVMLADNLTFGDFFRFLINEKDTINTVFTNALGGYDFNKFVVAFNKRKKKYETDINDIKFLQLEWRVEVENENIQIYTDFDGIGIDTNNESSNKLIGIGIDFTSLHLLKNIPLKLNKEFIIRDDKKKKNNIILKSYKDFTLFELINSILYEISFYGDFNLINQNAKKSNIDSNDGNYVFPGINKNNRKCIDPNKVHSLLNDNPSVQNDDLSSFSEGKFKSWKEFESMIGIWKGRRITLKSLRKKAWRRNKNR